MVKRFRITLDVDTTDKDLITHIYMKIHNCKYCVNVERTFSSFKGVHFVIYCTRECEICRFVYDDFRRFAYDANRPYYARNILFQEKEIIKLEAKNNGSKVEI